MNTRPPSGKPHRGAPHNDKLQSGKQQGGKPQDKNQPKKTVAEATGAPKREEASAAQSPAPVAARVAVPAPAPAAARAAAVEPTPAPPLPKRSLHLLDSAFESIERSFSAAKLGTVAVNRKLIDIARANVSSGFDLAMGLASAKTPMEAARLQMAFFDQHMKALAAQAQELRMLQAELVATASEPLREHVKRS